MQLFVLGVDSELICSKKGLTRRCGRNDRQILVLVELHEARIDKVLDDLWAVWHIRRAAKDYRGQNALFIRSESLDLPSSRSPQTSSPVAITNGTHGPF